MARYATEQSNLREALGASPVQNASQTLAIASQSSNLKTLVSDNFKKQLSVALPRHLTADRFARVILTECRKNPALAQCSQESFFGAVLQCAQLGLEPASALGHCYLVPYRNGRSQTRECQLLIGYRGMIDLARRSGQIKTLQAFVVYEDDEFSYSLGLHPDIQHKPSSKADKGQVVAVYAVAILADGGVQFEVMSRAEIDAIRNKSQGWVAYKKGYAKSCIWVDHYDEMARKTVVRRLFKMLPVSIEAQRAVYADEKAERGESLTTAEAIDDVFVDSGNTIEMPEGEEPADAEPEEIEAEAPAEYEDEES